MFSEELTPDPFIPSGTRRSPSSSGQPPVAQAKPMNILVIGDSHADMAVLHKCLCETRPGLVKLHWANSLSSGLERLSRHDVDLVLLDLSLPECSGLATFLTVRGQAHGIPIVVLTGVQEQELALEAVGHGAEDFVFKGQVDCPFDCRLVVRSVRFAVERVRRRRAERALRARQQEFRIARKIQQQLFPASPQVTPGLEVAGACYPATATGGDYFDFLPLGDGTLGLVVADASGHGTGPALIMASARAYLRALGQTNASVDRIMTLTNQLLVADTHQEHFVTMLLASVHLASGRLVYSSAGHSRGFILDSQGLVKGMLNSTNIPLGLDEHTDYVAAAPLAVKAGDLILMMTDGILESRSPGGALFGQEGMIEVVRRVRFEPPQQIVEQLYRAARRFSRLSEQQDDITALAARVTKR